MSRIPLYILLYWLALVLTAALTSCAANSNHNPASINGLAEAQGWTRSAEPRNIIMFRTGNPSETCRTPADGCEQHLSTVSIITTRQHWCSEPAGLIAHELAHACGWRHP